MDLMALVAFMHVSFMWHISVRFLSKITPRSRKLLVSAVLLLAMN